MGGLDAGESPTCYGSSIKLIRIKIFFSRYEFACKDFNSISKFGSHRLCNSAKGCL